MVQLYTSIHVQLAMLERYRYGRYRRVCPRRIRVQPSRQRREVR